MASRNVMTLSALLRKFGLWFHIGIHILRSNGSSFWSASTYFFFRRTNRRYGSIMIHESSKTDRNDSRNKSIRDIFVFLITPIFSHNSCNEHSSSLLFSLQVFVTMLRMIFSSWMFPSVQSSILITMTSIYPQSLQFLARPYTSLLITLLNIFDGGILSFLLCVNTQTNGEYYFPHFIVCIRSNNTLATARRLFFSRNTCRAWIHF